MPDIVIIWFFSAANYVHKRKLCLNTFNLIKKLFVLSTDGCCLYYSLYQLISMQICGLLCSYIYFELLIHFFNLYTKYQYLVSLYRYNITTQKYCDTTLCIFCPSPNVIVSHWFVCILVCSSELKLDSMVASFYKLL